MPKTQQALDDQKRALADHQEASGDQEQAPADRGKRIDLLLQIANHLESQINLGESRANLLLAACGAMVAVHAAAIQATDGFWSKLEPVGKFSFGLAAAALATAIFLGLRAVLPIRAVARLPAIKPWEKHQQSSIVHFGIIAAQSKSDFILSYRRMTERDIEDDLLDTLHGKSSKARLKFSQLRKVVFFLGASVFMFSLSLAILITPCNVLKRFHAPFISECIVAF